MYLIHATYDNVPLPTVTVRAASFTEARGTAEGLILAPVTMLFARHEGVSMETARLLTSRSLSLRVEKVS